jgi:RHS repeat-associated protein
LHLISQRQPGVGTNFFVSDGLGSTRVLTDGGANVANIFAYDAFGNLIASNGVPQTVYLYTGEQWDSDLSFYYLRKRMSAPNIGRFWQRDSFEGDGEDPLSLNLYVYCQNNPVNATDPLGLKITIKGPLSFQAKVKNDVQTIKNANPALKSMIDELDNSAYEHAIVPFNDKPEYNQEHGNVTRYKGHESTTFYDPCSRINGWRARMPVDSLAHELRHALSVDRGTIAYSTNEIHINNQLWDGVPYDEVPAVSYENLMRRANHEELRTSYFDPYSIGL